MSDRAPVWFVTGTDTGVGKTVFASLLVRRIREKGFTVRAVKPLCSGGRDDARALQEAAGGADRLDAVNPWHFRAALTPLLAARRARRKLSLVEVAAFLEVARIGVDLLIVEGAGGLLSPLGEDFDARHLIQATQAIPWIVTANRLGCLNHVLLTLEALGKARESARTVLMQPRRPGLVAHTNRDLLRERFGKERVLEIPWLREAGRAPLKGPWVRALDPSDGIGL